MLRPLGATLALCAVVLGWMAWGEMHARSLMDGLTLRAGRNHSRGDLGAAAHNQCVIMRHNFAQLGGCKIGFNIHFEVCCGSQWG